MRKKTILLYLILVTIFIGGCFNYGQDYKYTYTAKVTYTDSAIDTMIFSYDSFKGNPVYVYISTSNDGFLTSGTITPSLIIGCGFRSKVIACGVRKYEILNESKVELNDNLKK